MARAHWHYLAEQIWYLTHRCHERQFLLEFARDRQAWIGWLFEARKCFGLFVVCVLGYMVTSNHIHLLVCDREGRDVIPDSMQLVAGRCGQEYNHRKQRKGAYWEDRYHAAAVGRCCSKRAGYEWKRLWKESFWGGKATGRRALRWAALCVSKPS